LLQLIYTYLCRAKVFLQQVVILLLHTKVSYFLTPLFNNFCKINYSNFYFFYMNIFVAGLSYQITDADLKELFEEYGEVSSAKIITDRETRRSKGYGFVEMSNEGDGQRAIEELNDAEYDGRTLSVSVARPRTERPAGGGGNRGGYGNRDRNRY
jgi:RNA recognition motif-containing protein